MSKYYFSDFSSYTHPVESVTKKDAKSLLDSSKKPSLRITVDTTHSGLLTNRRVYPAKKVMTGYKSFFSKKNGGSAEYDKPVLIAHDMEADAIGRVVKATYSPFKLGRELDLDFLYPEKEGKGSGVVTTTALIYDPESIQKIIDGRYLTVSAGHATDAMFCSICGDSIFDCDHIPGSHYTESGEKTSDSSEAPLCYGITNNMTYNEFSFVNLPAQATAKLVEYNWENTDAYKGKNLKDEIFFSFTKSGSDHIKDLTLMDEDVELSLLTGKESTAVKKAYFIPPNTAEILKSKLDTDDDSEPANGHESSSLVLEEKSSTPDNSGKDNIEPRKGVKTMDENEKLLNELKQKVQGLEESVATATAALDEAKTLIASKDSEITSLKGDNDSLKADMAEHLATALASYRIRLKKPDTVGLDTDAKRQEYVSKLAKRSLDSLKDSLKDLSTEVEEHDSRKIDVKSGSAEDLLAGDKVTNPALAGNKNTKKKAAKSELESFLEI